MFMSDSGNSSVECHQLIRACIVYDLPGKKCRGCYVVSFDADMATSSTKYGTPVPAGWVIFYQIEFLR